MPFVYPCSSVFVQDLPMRCFWRGSLVKKGWFEDFTQRSSAKNPPLIFFKKGPGETFVVKLPQSCTVFFLKSWCVSSLGNVCTSLATTCNWSDPNERRSEAQRNETRWPAAIGAENILLHRNQDSKQRELLWMLVERKGPTIGCKLTRP